jgi:two-component system response regulator YesN
MWSLMIVDDEELIREGLRDLISWDQYGVRVVGEAAGGEEALRKTRTQRPDIIVTDVVMPDMNGLELVERLRSMMMIC